MQSKMWGNLVFSFVPEQWWPKFIPAVSTLTSMDLQRCICLTISGSKDRLFTVSLGDIVPLALSKDL